MYFNTIGTTNVLRDFLRKTPADQYWQRLQRFACLSIFLTFAIQRITNGAACGDFLRQLNQGRGARNGDPLYSAEVHGSKSLWNQARRFSALPPNAPDLQKTWKKTWKKTDGILA